MPYKKLIILSLAWVVLNFALVTCSVKAQPDPPTGLSPNSTVIPGTTTEVTLWWDDATGIDNYGIRVEDNTNGSLRDPRNNCDGDPHYLCIDHYNGNSINISVIPGHSYTWWLHAIDSQGVWGDAPIAEFYVNYPVWSVSLDEAHHPFRGVGWNVHAGHTSYELLDALSDTTQQFVRVVGWLIECYQPDQATKTYESDSMQKIYSFLEFAKDNKISVMLTNWDCGGKWDNYYACPSVGGWDPVLCPEGWPDHPFWLSEISHNDPTNSQNRFCHRNYMGDPGICSDSEKRSRINIKGVESDHPYSDSVFAETLVNHLDYMINTRGYEIDFLTLWNEPNGDWAYHPRNESKKYPSSFTGLYQNVYQELDERGLLDELKLTGMDETIDSVGSSTKNNIDVYATGTWSPYVQAYSLHNYDAETGANGTVKYLVDRAQGRPVIIGEVGHFGSDGCSLGGFDRWGNSIESTRLMLSDIRHGAYATARWWFNGGDPATDCWVAIDTVNGMEPIPETYNSVKILANTLPQTREDISVVNTDFGDFGEDFEVVVINADSTGQKPWLVVWAVNKGQDDYHLNLDVSGLPPGTTDVSTKILQGIEPFEIESGPRYSMSPSEHEISLVVPSDSIFIAEAERNNARFSSQSVPSVMIRNQTYNVSITMNNIGKRIWTQDLLYGLGTQNPRDNFLWMGDSNRIYLDNTDSIEPGQSKTFVFDVTAPTVPGEYDFQWRMVQEYVEWFGDITPNLAIKVIHPADSNQDVCIVMREMVAFIDLWKYDSTTYPMREMMEAVSLWKSGTGCS